MSGRPPGDSHEHAPPLVRHGWWRWGATACTGSKRYKPFWWGPHGSWRSDSRSERIASRTRSASAATVMVAASCDNRFGSIGRPYERCL